MLGDSTPQSKSQPRRADARTEAKCLIRSVIPMSDDAARRAAEKLIAVCLVVVWLIGTLALTFETIEAVQPPFWLPFTALVFLLVGRLWDLEVRKILPGGGSK